jgi:signal peptidase I
VVETMDSNYQNDKNESRRFVTGRWIDKFESTGHGWLMITSGSMYPLIKSGDLLHVEKTTVSAVYPGDIIAFWKGNRLITHRVILKAGNNRQTYFIERADRHPEYSIVNAQSLVGKVKSIKRNERVYHLEKLRWQLFNRGIGATFFCTYKVRKIIQKIDFVPKQVKDIIRKILISSRTLREKLLANFLSRK